MGLKSGDKGRHYRARRKKLAKRVKMRELFGGAAPKKSAEPAPKADTARPANASSE